MKTQTQTQTTQNAPAADTAPVTVTNQTVADLAKAIAASRLAPTAPADQAPDGAQDTATETAAEESHPSIGGDVATDHSQHTQEGEAAAATPETESEAEAEAGTEQEAQPEQAADTEADAEETPHQGETAEQRIARVERALAKAQKRIAKLTAQKHAAAEATPAQTQQQAQAQPAEAPMPLPTAQVPKLVELDKQIARTEALESWLESEGAGGGEFTDPGTGQKYAIAEGEVEQARRFVASTKRDLVADRAVAKAEAQRAWTQEQAALSAQLAKEFPQFTRNDSPERAQMEHLMSQIPANLRTAGARLLVAKALAYDAMQRKAKPATPQPRSVKAGTQPTPVAMRPAAAARPGSANQQALKEAQEAYQRTGSVKDLARVRSLTRAAG